MALSSCGLHSGGALLLQAPCCTSPVHTPLPGRAEGARQAPPDKNREAQCWDRLAGDTGPRESLDTGQEAVFALCHPGRGGEVEVYGESCQERAGRRGRVEKSFSCESRDNSCHHGGEARGGGKLDPTPARAVSAESKQAVRNMRPLKIQ